MTQPKFGSIWSALVAKDQDWGPEDNRQTGAFDTTEPGPGLGRTYPGPPDLPSEPQIAIY